MDYPMIMAGVDDSLLHGRQQASKPHQVQRKKVEKLLKRELRKIGFVVPNQLQSKVYILNLSNRHNRNNDERTVGFGVKKCGKEYYVFYRFNGTMAIFQKAYIEACMARKDDAPFFKLSPEQPEEFDEPRKSFE